MTVNVITGDALDVLRGMPAESVHCCVSSPPYFGLRDYNVVGQIGLEESPADYVAAMVRVFHEVRRVLRDDGTLWCNLGDSYANDGKWGGHTGGKHVAALHCSPIGRNKRYTGLKPKDLCMIPARVALALQEDGWYLRSDIIWSKPNPMPESVTDRPTKAHEYIFLLSKSERYYYDADAIREENSETSHTGGQYREPWKYEAIGHGSSTSVNAVGVPIPRNGRNKRTVWTAPRYTGQATKDYAAAGAQNPSDSKRRILAAMADPDYVGANKRSVWTVTTKPYSGAHFATFPPDLIEPCILAGCPPTGTVLDPFGGAGTTGLVADRLQRNAILIEINPAYAQMARERISSDCPMFTEVTT